MNRSYSSLTTLTELLKWRALHSPHEVAFIVEGKSYSYAWLWENCQRYASLLSSENVAKKDKVLVLVPNSAAFFVAFYGCILCGAIVVPVFPNAGTERCAQIMQLCGGRHLILPADIHEDRKNDFSTWAEANGLLIHWVNESPETNVSGDFPHITADEIAFIQYTSGSTDFPKGVPLMRTCCRI